MVNIEKYSYQVAWSEEDEAYVARVLEFPSLAAHGDSLEAALRELKSVVEVVCEELREEEAVVPEPLSLASYSGRFNVRLPSELHRELVICAQRAGCSLNQYVVSKLSR